MLTLFSNFFKTAARFETDRPVQRRPNKSWEIEQKRAEDRRRAMRNVGMW